jgi:hypothetical protein
MIVSEEMKQKMREMRKQGMYWFVMEFIGKR